MTASEAEAFVAAGAERLRLTLSADSRRAVEANVVLLNDLAAQVAAALPADAPADEGFSL